ncbi:MAG TPA: hemolysin family protein [Abditibacteriaceae bacterium]|jgi:magnesium and cobalt transporter
MFTVCYIALIFCLLLVALLAASEAALAASNRVRLRHMLQAQASQSGDDHGAVQLLSNELSGDAQRFIATVTIAANMPLLAAAALTVWLAQNRYGRDWIALLLIGAVAFATISIFQITPRLLMSRPGALERLWWVRPARFLVAILRPPVSLLIVLGTILLRLFGLMPSRRAAGSEERTRDRARDDEDESVAVAVGGAPEIRDLVESARESGAIEESGRELIESIFTFGDTRVREVMIPRPDILGLPVDASVNRVLDALQESGYTRLPIYEENIDRVVGVLHAKDVLRALGRGENAFVAQGLMRPALYLPESQPIDEALATMRSKRTHLAIVIDEYGGTAGLLTVEDILEELVGDIADEHDQRVENPLQIVDENTAVVDAGLHTDDLEEDWDLPLPTGEFDTVGGFMIEQLGRALVVGDRVETPGATLTVQSVRGRRPKRILIIKKKREEKREARDDE